MHEITLRTLECRESEDWGGDECLLDIEVDGRQQPYLRRNLDDGQTWILNQSYRFGDNVKITLWDEDSPDADDRLGTVGIDASPTAGTTASFTGDDAEYHLAYVVREAPDKDPVTTALNRFRQSSRPGVWRNIPKQRLVTDIERTIDWPLSVSQDGVPLCGPAAVVYELVRKNPARYVEICQSLYENGYFQGREERVEPSETLRNSRKHSGMSPADWMLCASMRDVANEIFDVEESSGEFVMGLSTPWEMMGWTEDLLGYDNVDYESTYFYGEFKAMQKAHGAVQRGGVAFLMVHGDIVNSRAPSFGYPNHWVSYLGGLDIDEGVWYIWDSGRIHFRCYSWGREMKVNISEGPFEDGFWGVVTGY